MRQICILILGIFFIFLGHGKAYSLPQGLGLENAGMSVDSFLNNQDYKVYAKAVRIKIGDNTYKRFDVIEAGVVSFDFEINSEGKLVNVRVNNDRTSASQKLINTALMAIKNSSPFDPFPPSLAKDYHKLPFTIKLEVKSKQSS